MRTLHASSQKLVRTTKSKRRNKILYSVEKTDGQLQIKADSDSKSVRPEELFYPEQAVWDAFAVAPLDNIHGTEKLNDAPAFIIFIAYKLIFRLIRNYPAKQ
ncbi:MAG TPA: hypothetical protein V6C97_08470 [Oculatellaceae cyanobacterium]